MPPRFTGALHNSIDAIAPEINFGGKLIVGNLWLFEPAARSYLARRPETDALIRTTTAATVFQAGVKDNVLPERARAVVNFRILPGDSVHTVLEHVRKVVHDDRIDIRAIGPGSDPSPVSDVHSKQYQLVEGAIRSTMPDAVVAPYVILAATDSRSFSAICPNVFRFSPARVGRADIARVHGLNERVSVDNLGEIVTFYTTLIRSADR